MKLTEDEASDLSMECHPDFECVEAGDWIGHGKFDLRRSVFKHIPTGKFYEQTNMRHGDHWSGYEFDPDKELNEVQPVEITVREWVRV